MVISRKTLILHATGVVGGGGGGGGEGGSDLIAFFYGNL